MAIGLESLLFIDSTIGKWSLDRQTIDNAFLRVDHLPVALFSPLSHTKLRLLGALYTQVSNVFYNTIVQLFELQMKNNCYCV
jgi:hypothetical protein